MAIGVVRFNFTVTLPDPTLAHLKQLIFDRLAGSGIDIAPNTFSLEIEAAIPSTFEPPSLPGFKQIRGTIRQRS